MHSVSKVVVLGDTRIVREGLERVLSQHPAFKVVGAADGGQGADAVILAAQPDLALVDSGFLRFRGLFRRLAGHCPGMKIVVYGISETQEEVLACAEAGASAYVRRDASAADLFQTLLATLQGELYCSPRIAAFAFQRIATLASTAGHDAAPPLELSRRQTQILSLIDQGLSNKQIARQLGIELSTVKNHVHQLLARVGARRRSVAAAQARLAGLPADRPAQKPGPESGF